MPVESTNFTAPLLPAPVSTPGIAIEQPFPTGVIEARLICIFDRAYDIQHNQNLQTELAKLIYLKHVKNVIVDSDSTPATGSDFITDNTAIHIEKQGAAKYIYGEILKNPGLLQTYLETGGDGVKNAVKLYIAPTIAELETLVKNATGSNTLDKQNSVYMLRPQDESVMLQLIKVLQRMGFNKHYFKAGIHMQTNQVNPILGNAIAKIIPDILQDSNHILLSVVSSGPRLTASAAPINPLATPANIKMTITSITNNLAGFNTILLTPDATIDATSPQSLSILNFLGIKPDTKSEFKNMSKNRDALAKTNASDHHSDAIAALGKSVPEAYRQNIEKEIPAVKTSLEAYKTALKEYVSKFEKFEKEYKSGSGEKARIYKKYIAGIFGELKKGKNDNAEGFKIRELYYRLLKDYVNNNNNKLLKKQIYQQIVSESTNITDINNISKDKLVLLNNLIKQFTYGVDDDATHLDFNESVILNTIKHNEKFKNNEKYIANTKDFFDRTRDLAYILEYINGYSYYKRNIYNLNHIIRYYNEQHLDLKARKTLKNGVPEQRKIPPAKYTEITDVPNKIKTQVTVKADNVKEALQTQITNKTKEKTSLKENKQTGLKHIWGKTRKNYRKARELSGEITDLQAKVNMIQTPVAAPALPPAPF